MHPSERPLRLRRLDRLFTQHPLYFVTACTLDRQPILAQAQVHEAFQTFCQAGLERGVFVGKYVLMPDHLHLFVAFGEEYEQALAAQKTTGRTDLAAQHIAPLSAWMKSLKNALSKTWREQGLPGPHWQKGFFDHLMRSEESYSEKWRYVAENPVRRNLVTGPENWPYQGEIYPLQAHGPTSK